MAVVIKDARYVDVLFLGQPADEAGRRGAFKVQMQLNLGQGGVDPFGYVRSVIPCSHGRKLLPGPRWPRPRCAATVAATSTKAQGPICPAP